MRKWIFILLSFSTPAFLHAGGNLSLTSPQFSSGSSTNTVVQDSSLTLIKEWSFGGQAAPAGRYHTGFAMDETRNQALLFGGQNELGSTFGDTWVWDLSGGWVQRTPSGPPASRYGHGLVWIGDKFLLFGGSANNQTWAYDIAADTWTYIPVSQSPDSRTLFGMAYDPDQNVAVVFGGVSDNATWIYDVAASSWSVFNLSPAPSARTGTQMVYDKTQRRILLFGGKDWNSSALLDDTWSLDVGNKIWTQKNPTAKPEARSEGALAYDVFNGRVFLYGGSVSAGLAGDLWFYDFGADRWSQHYEFDPNQPAGRFGHGLIYHTQDQKAMIFGGKQDVAVRSVWRYVFRSTGIWSSAALDVWAGFSNVTPNTWDSLTTTFNSKPSYTDVLLQLASSSDGNTYDSFRGPDGSTQTFYASSPTPQTVWTGHSDKRFIKLKAAFNSNDPPARAKVAEFNIAYNRAPFSPVLKSPADNARINDSTPLLAWNLTSDPDGIFTDSPLLYQVQVDTDPVFSSADISEENIPAGSSEVSFTTGTLLPEGLWYWRTRAKDPAGLYGVWSSTFSVLIDTHTPPGPVTSMTASLGPANGFISLLWTFPGDDKGRVDNGRYRIRFSTSGSILTEGAWSGIIEERNSLFSANPGENVQSIVTGLSDAATYFFAVKTEDELGNLSPLSAVSPFAMTNASPTVALLSPNGGEFIQMITTISWNQSDPNLGDVLTKALRYSSDGGANFSVLIASGIATGTTFYLWDSRGVPNTVSGRIKIEVVDQRGFSAADASNGNFQVDNVNEAPVVQWSSAPANAQEVSGVLTVSWSVADPNLLDTHAYSVLLSPDSGGSFFTLASGISQSSHTFNTAVFSNLTTYRLKVVATDSGTPVLSGEALSPVFSIVNTLPPNSFNLLSPLQLDFPSVFDLKFSWEAASDPEGGAVSYRLQYSTVSGPADGTVVSGLNQTNYTPALNSLLMDTEYFWQVTALDPYLRETQSTVGRFILSRLKSKTSDRFLQVEVLSGMPANGYLDFQNAVVSYSDLLARAEEDSKADRFKKVLSYPAWQIQVKDISGNTLSSDGIAARLTYNFSTNSSNSEQIKIAKLNQSLGRWEVLSSPQTYDSSARQLTATVQGFSVFNVIASVTPSQTLSGVTNFPNPFAAGKETTRIRYVLTQDSKVTIRFYTLLGDLVRVLEFEPGSSGGTGIPVGYTNEVTWDGKNGGGQTVANGMYVAQIRAESSEGIVTEIRRIGVLK